MRGPYAPGARNIVIDKNGTYEIPRTQNLHFRGFSPIDPEIRVALTLVPHTGAIYGIVNSPAGFFVISAPGTAGNLRSTISSTEALKPPGAPELISMCGNDELEEHLPSLEAPPQSTVTLPVKGVVVDPLYQAVIAFDSDNEWNYYRFNNDTTAAANWIADYINDSNVMYERDLLMRLLIGDTLYRLDTDSSPTFDDDPYTVTGSPASISHLNEFGAYWSANYGAVDRVLAQLLSGKSGSESSSSGIAWLDGYCEYQTTGGGYSIFQPFKATWVPMSYNVNVGAHELGHNFSSPHTHCYSPPVDECFNAEGGCYSGVVSCPGGGPGTMMSYCHFGAPYADCGQNLVEFHPTVISYIDGYRAAHTPWCIENYAPDGLIFNDDFESGGTTNWSSTAP